MEKKMKHLEFIQNVIARKNSNSFLIKGWAVTLVSATFALAAKDANIGYLLICFISVPVFWGLDAFYLNQERCYRALYNDVATDNASVPEFSMDASKYDEKKNTWLCCLVSRSIWPVYTVVILISAILVNSFPHTFK